MAIKNSTYRIFRKLSALALFAGAAACSHSDDPMAPVAGDGVEFRFEIVTGSLVPAVSGGSRAVTMPANTQQGTLAENYLDLENITFLFFDADKRLIAPFHPEVTPVEDSRFVRYEVSAEVADAYFTRPSTPQVTFYIMALANYSAFDPRNFNFTRGMSMEAVFDAAPSFRMPEASPWWYPHIETLDGSSGAWPTAPQHIPMAGVQSFTVDASEFTSSNERIELTKDINMLRAMAKIEVIDRIEAVGKGVDTTQPPADKRASIEKVELMGCYSRGGILPNMAQWDKRGDIETDYVSAPSVGKRISIRDTRGIIDAILDGAILKAPTKQIPIFDFTVPTELPGVDPNILDPRDTYTDAAIWNEKATKLAEMFINNFKKFEHNEAGKALVAAGPRL